MELGLSTAFVAAGALRGAPIGPDRIVDLLLRSGARGVELHSGLPPALLDELAPRLLARREELPIIAVENVCPAARVGAAELASLDRDESRAAVAAARETIRLTGELAGGSGPLVLLRLGEVRSLGRGWPSVRRAFLRGELAEADRRRERLLRERALAARPYLDQARRALDELASVSDGAGVRLGLRNPSRYLGLPSPRELPYLLADLAGAPVVPVFDAAAAHLADAMGLGPLSETVAAWKPSPLLHLADACGAIAGLPGRGELDLPSLARDFDPKAHAVFVPWDGLVSDEIAAAMDSLRTLLP